MTNVTVTRLLFVPLAGAAVLGVTLLSARQQPAPGAVTVLAPAAGPGQGAAGRGRGLPNATPEQLQVVADMNTALASLNAAVTAARADLVAVVFADGKNETAIRSAVEKVRAAELALATRRADEFARLQDGPNKLTPEQVTALIAAGGSAPAAGRGGRGGD